MRQQQLFPTIALPHSSGKGLPYLMTRSHKHGGRHGARDGLRPVPVEFPLPPVRALSEFPTLQQQVRFLRCVGQCFENVCRAKGDPPSGSERTQGPIFCSFREYPPSFEPQHPPPLKICPNFRCARAHRGIMYCKGGGGSIFHVGYITGLQLKSYTTPLFGDCIISETSEVKI